LGFLTCKNRLPYNLYCVGGDKTLLTHSLTHSLTRKVSMKGLADDAFDSDNILPL